MKAQILTSDRAESNRDVRNPLSLAAGVKWLIKHNQYGEEENLEPELWFNFDFTGFAVGKNHKDVFVWKALSDLLPAKAAGTRQLREEPVFSPGFSVRPLFFSSVSH